MITATRLALIGVLCMLLLSAGTTPTFADSPSSGGDITAAQSLGDRELTVVLRRVTGVPGPLRVDVITHTGTAPGRLSLQVTPTGSGTPADQATVNLGPTPAAYSATVTVDRPGPWELAIGDGQRVSRIPFVVPVQATSPPERAVYGGFLATGVLLLVSVVVATRARRSGWTLLPVAGLVAALSVALTAAVLSASLPLPPQPGSQLDPTIDNVSDPYSLPKPPITDFSRPPIVLALNGTPLTAGLPGDLGLDLTDGATGATVDDLLVHDSALIHLLVIGPTGQLWHLHPIRIAPGRYQVHLTLPLPGHYALSAEMVRRGGGVQLVRAASGLDVAPAEAPTVRAITDPIHLGDGSVTGTTVIDSTPVTVTTTDPVAGTPTTITGRIGDTAELQPWLGMAGHMIVAGPLSTIDVGTAVQTAPVWAHAHSMGGMSMTGAMVRMAPVNGDSAPDETVAAYGPDVPFTYTFPIPGKYRLWVQVERHYTVLTVPVTIDVASGKAGQR